MTATATRRPKCPARHDAAILGLRWADVLDAARELRKAAQQERTYHNGLREYAWKLAMVSQPGKWSFWRCGFLNTYGRLLETSDYTAIPRFDTLAAEVALAFPEWNDAEKLWDFLLSPHDPLPSMEEFVTQAIDMLAYYQGVQS